MKHQTNLILVGLLLCLAGTGLQLLAGILDWQQGHLLWGAIAILLNGLVAGLLLDTLRVCWKCRRHLKDRPKQ